jgi:inward rectifier potassium channel
MAKTKDDLGLDRGAQKGRQRTINLDGTYNIKRIGEDASPFEIYHWLINTRWSHYWLTVVLFYGVMNALFAICYLFIGVEHFSGITDEGLIKNIEQCFFFSVQTFTTVGYGGIHPTNMSSNLVASFEAFIGLMSFALATGTLYGRFSRPNAKIKYSENVIITPFEDKRALQFMVANKRSSNLMEMEATVNLSWVENNVRTFAQLELQITKVAMMPTSWTVNHIINDESPLRNFDLKAILEKEVEIFVLLKGFDETFSQTIYSRHSFVAKEFVWGAKFVRPFHVDENGKLIMNIDKVGLIEKAEIEA